MGNLPLIFMHPLAGHLDRHAPFIINISQAGLRLQEGMFLSWSAILSLDHHRRFGKTGLDIPLPNAIMVEDVVLSIRMKPECPLLHALLGVRYYRQVFKLDLDQLRGLSRDFLALCDHNRQLVSYEAHPFRVWLARSGTT